MGGRDLPSLWHQPWWAMAYPVLSSAGIAPNIPWQLSSFRHRKLSPVLEVVPEIFSSSSPFTVVPSLCSNGTGLDSEFSWCFVSLVFSSALSAIVCVRCVCVCDVWSTNEYGFFGYDLRSWREAHLCDFSYEKCRVIVFLLPPILPFFFLFGKGINPLRNVGFKASHFPQTFCNWEMVYYLVFGSCTVSGRHLALFIRSYLVVTRVHFLVGTQDPYSFGAAQRSPARVCRPCHAPASQPTTVYPGLGGCFALEPFNLGRTAPVRCWLAPRRGRGALGPSYSAGPPGSGFPTGVSGLLSCPLLNDCTFCSCFLLLQTSFPSFQLDCFIYALDL